MPYKFKYFDVRGIVHYIRYMLEDNEIEYEEPKVPLFNTEEWQKVQKAKMRFGKVPGLEDGDLDLYETGAIVRHLARKHDLYGDNINEAALIDMTFCAMIDLRDKMLNVVFTRGDFEKAKKEYDTSTLPTALEKIEILLKENDNGQSFFVGKRISFADYGMFDLLVNTSVFVPGCLDQYPVLTAFVERMSARPNIAKYVAGERHKSLPITPSDRLK